MSCEDIPSLLDLQNTKKHVDDFGRLMGDGEGDSTNEVTGQVRPTYNKVMKSVGFKPGSGDFTTGFTVMPGERDIAWYDPVSLNWYSYLGVIPTGGYYVTPGTNPVGNINWKPVTDEILRNQLAANSGAGMVGTSTGKTVEQDLQQSGLARGNDGVSYSFSGCALRRDTAIGPDWAPVADSAHLPINIASVSTGVDVTVDFAGIKVGSLLACPDESFAKDGTLVGGSGGGGLAVFSMGAQCSFSVDLTTHQFQFDSKYFDPVRFGISVSGGGIITLTHPGIRTMLHPIIRYVAPASTSKHLDVHYQQHPTTGSTTLFLVGDVEGTISYNGTDWVVGSCDQWVTSDLTFSWDSAQGALTVTHPTLVGSPELNLTALYQGSPLVISGSSAGPSGFKVQFHKLDGSTPTIPGASLGFLFSRGKNGLRKAPAGKLLVHLGYVQVNCSHVDYPGGNFWFYNISQN